MDPLKYNSLMLATIKLIILLSLILNFNPVTSFAREARVSSIQNHGNKANPHQPSPRSKESDLSSFYARDDPRGSSSSQSFFSSSYNSLGITHRFDSLKYTLSKSDYCIATTQNLSFCPTRLGWGTNMGVPNFLNLKTERELAEMASKWHLDEIVSVKCEASYNLKVLLCSLLAPACLDIMVPPCKRMCLATRSSCEPALIQQGYKWPSFLDCRRFPRTQEVCLSRQPVFLDHDAVISLETARQNIKSSSNSSARALMKQRRKEKKYRSRLTTTTTANSIMSTSTSMPLTTTRDYQTKLLEDATTSKSQLDVSNLPDTTLSSTSLITTSAPTLTTSTTPSNSIASVSSTTQLPVQESKIHELGNKISSELSNVSIVRDYSSMPVNVTTDLTKLLCSTSPTWFVKAKLTDNQLISAVEGRRLKVKSFRQIFGSPASVTTRIAYSNSTHPTARKNNLSPSLYVTLSNTTIFVTAMGPHMYTQPLNGALPKSTESQANQLRSVRYYLIAGTSLTGSSLGKLATVFVVWPNISRTTSNIDPDSRGGLSIINAYREFKRRGARVCEEVQSSFYSPISSLPASSLMNDATILQNDSVFEETIGMRRIKGSTRFRTKKRRVQTTVAPL